MLTELCHVLATLTKSDQNVLAYNFFSFLQLAEVSARFPSCPSIYRLAEQWQIPRTFAAAFYNDIVELKSLKQRRQLEPNARLQWPAPWATVTPLCWATDTACLRFLLANKADVHADVQPAGGDFCPLVHEVARRCTSSQLRILLAAGADRDVNTLCEGGTALHRLRSPGAIMARCMYDVPPAAHMRQCAIADWEACFAVLLRAGADPSLPIEGRPDSAPPSRVLPSSLLLGSWPKLSELLEPQRAVRVYKQLLLGSRRKAGCSLQQIVEAETFRLNAWAQRRGEHFGNARVQRSIASILRSSKQCKLRQLFSACIRPDNNDVHTLNLVMFTDPHADRADVMVSFE